MIKIEYIIIALWSALTFYLYVRIKKRPDTYFPDVNKKCFISKDSFFVSRHYTERYIRYMSWRSFEKFIESLFIYNGFSTQLTPPANDGGKDIIAWKDDIVFFIECKHWSADAVIGREHLQKLIGAAISNNVYNVVFVATCQYNENAFEYADTINKKSPMVLELWSINDIVNFPVRQYSFSRIRKG